MKLIYTFAFLFLLCSTASAQKKTFAVHYNTMIGTSTDEIRFSQNGNNDVWAP